MPLILCEQRETAVVSAGREGEDLWTAPADLERATGWALKPEGLCRGPICIPLKPERRAAMVRGDIAVDGANARINLTALWRGMGNPIVHDTAGDAWVLGTGAGERAQTLQSLDAPDFSLTDLEGRTHTLAQQRGKKVFLATWASW
jgi:hypothetical protein